MFYLIFLALTLQREEKPSFQTITIEEKNVDPDVSNVNLPIENIEIDGTENRRKNSHHFIDKSTVYIKDSNFSGCFSIGASFETGAGGGFFMVETQLIVSGSIFDHNEAIFGGAICLINSDSTFSDSNFTENRAYFIGGAICTLVNNRRGGNSGDKQFDGQISSEKVNFFQVTKTFFIGNKAREFCGAIAASKISDSWISDCLFENNEAQHSAGAIGVYESCHFLIFQSSFISNTCGKRSQLVKFSNSNKGIFNHVKAFRPAHLRRYKGGGAILIKQSNLTIIDNSATEGQDNSGDSNTPLYQRGMYFATEKCCFAGNKCLAYTNNVTEITISDTVVEDKGFDILLNSFTNYQSYEDTFINKFEVSIQIIYDSKSDQSENETTKAKKNVYVFGTRFQDPEEDSSRHYNSPNKCFAGKSGDGEEKPGKFINVMNRDKYIGLLNEVKNVVFPATKTFEELKEKSNDSIFKEVDDNDDFPVNTPPQSKPPKPTTQSQTPNMYKPSSVTFHRTTRSIHPSYSPSSHFSKSNYFTKSDHFTISNFFPQTEHFTLSTDFTQSTVFTKSTGFTKSDYFTISMHFTESHHFANSEYFSRSEHFSKSNAFTVSEKFTLSTVFSVSKPFTLSGLFTSSNAFHPTDLLESATYEFTDSNRFTESEGFIPSNIFTASKLLPSHSFSPSNKAITIDQGSNTKKSILGLIIGIVCGIVALILVIIFVIIYCRKKDGSSEEREMNEERTEMTSEVTKTVTADNPLWMSRYKLDNTDDPFKNDFQEEISPTIEVNATNKASSGDDNDGKI